jgi:hypothetical protein
MKPVGIQSEMALRAALARLVEGRPARTDGRLSIANLALEAGLARATAHRASAIIAELKTLQGVSQARELPPDRFALEEARARRDADHLHAQHLQVRALLSRAESRRQAAATTKIHPLRRDD